MNTKELVARIMAFNQPASAYKDGHVAMVFSDGEICMTKSGDLLGMRSMHLMHVGCLDIVYWGRELQAALKEAMPEKRGDHSFFYTSERNEDELARIFRDVVNGVYLTTEDLNGSCNEAVVLSRKIYAMTQVCDAITKRNSELLAMRDKEFLEKELAAAKVKIGDTVRIHIKEWGGRPAVDRTGKVTAVRRMHGEAKIALDGVTALEDYVYLCNVVEVIPG